MKHLNWILICTLLVTMLSASCHNDQQIMSRIPVVKVYDKYLYQDDIEALVPEGTTPQDSALKVKSYVDVWVRKQLMVKKAELYLTDEQKDVERQLEDYRASLLIYKYKDKYLLENFDTTVTPREVEEYYRQHFDDFKLQRNAVKAFFVKIPLESNEIQHLKMLWISVQKKTRSSFWIFAATTRSHTTISAATGSRFTMPPKACPKPLTRTTTASRANA